MLPSVQRRSGRPLGRELDLTGTVSGLGAGTRREQNAEMKDYVQYCPVALASSEIAESWTP